MKGLSLVRMAGGEVGIGYNQVAEWQHMSGGVEVRQDSKRDPWYRHAPALGGWSSQYS